LCWNTAAAAAGNENRKGKEGMKMLKFWIGCGASVLVALATHAGAGCQWSSKAAGAGKAGGASCDASAKSLGQCSKTAAECADAKDCKPGSAECAKKCGDKQLSAPAAAKALSTDELKAMIGSKDQVVVLDARSGKYDDGRRIPGARQLASSADAEAIAAALPSKDATVVTYCSSPKCPASKKLAAKLSGMGYSKVFFYPDGIAGWVDSGNNVEGGAATN
jgi:rhodanese-related sulfurtransferase